MPLRSNAYHANMASIQRQLAVRMMFIRIGAMGSRFWYSDGKLRSMRAGYADQRRLESGLPWVIGRTRQLAWRDADMGQFRGQISGAWLAAAMAIIAVNLAGIVASLNRMPVLMSGGVSGANFLISRMYDGSVVKYVFPWTGGRIGPIVIEPVSPIGLLRVWWPLAFSIGVSLLILGVPRIDARWRRGESIRPPRMTMIQGIVLIGLISFGLWLVRFNLYLISAGFLVLGLLLHTLHRRKALVDETSDLGGNAPALSRIGIAGYSIAALLAVAWVISTLVWDSYQRGRP
jgi:hypothetical protein